MQKNESIFYTNNKSAAPLGMNAAGFKRLPTHDVEHYLYGPIKRLPTRLRREYSLSIASSASFP